MKKYLILLCLFASLQGFSQPDAVFSSYNYNQFVINPAYAGSRRSMSAVLMHRTRWTGIEGAPTTSTLSFHSDLNKKSFAWGINLGTDRLGPVSNSTAALTGAYHLPFRTGKLSFGLRLGLFNSAVNGAELDFRDPTDAFNTGSKYNALLPSADFGLYYYTSRFYAGLSLNHLGASRFDFSDLPDAEYYLRQYNTLGLGYAFQVADNLVLKPSLLLKQSVGFDANLDINVSALFYEKVWFGVSLRNQSAISLLLDVNITDFMRVGYAYDAFVNGLNQASNGGHEFFIGFDFQTSQPKVVSPRYL